MQEVHIKKVCKNSILEFPEAYGQQDPFMHTFMYVFTSLMCGVKEVQSFH